MFRIKSSTIGMLGAVLLLGNTTHGDWVEWPVATGGNGHLYRLTGTLGSWLDAEAEAELTGGFLATVNSSSENTWIQSEFGGEPNWWIGFYQDFNDPGYSEPAGGWKWISGEPVTYTNWISGEPNDNSGEQWTEMKGNQSTWADQWNDQGDDLNHRGLVELDPVLDLIFLTAGGSLNGQGIDESTREITVAPGASIAGSVNIQLYNPQPAASVFPFGATPTWGDRSTAPFLIDADAPTGLTDYAVPITLTAPTEPGTYYIVFAAAPRFGIDQVFSATSAGCSAIWNDYNDVGWDWTQSQFDQAELFGNAEQLTYNCVDGYVIQERAANWIKITVQSPCHPADLDGDGDVDVIDFGIFVGLFGCPN